MVAHGNACREYRKITEIRSSLEIEVISGPELIEDFKRMIRKNIDELALS